MCPDITCNDQYIGGHKKGQEHLLCEGMINLLTNTLDLMQFIHNLTQACFMLGDNIVACICYLRILGSPLLMWTVVL